MMWAALALTVTLSSSAMAADWSGGYAGLNVGYAQGQSKNSLGGGASGPAHLNGWLSGGHVGFNWQLASKVVLGIEAGGQWRNAKGDDLTYNVEQDLEFSVVAREGFLPTPEVLVYGLFGFSWIREQIESRTLPFAGPIRFSGEHLFSGPAVGGGIEFIVAPGWTLRAEYRHSQYDPVDVTHSNPLGSGTLSYRFKPSADTFAQGISIRF